MDTRRKDLITFFIVPGFLVTTVYAVLNAIWPSQFQIWIGLLVGFAVSATIMAWSEISKSRTDLKSLRAEFLGNAKVYTTYANLLRDSDEAISNGANQLIDVMIYKAYSTDLDKEGHFFGLVAKAMENKQVDTLNRIVVIRNQADVEAALGVMKMLAKSEDARLRTRFFVNFSKGANYFSFLVIGDNESFIALPDLSIAPSSIVGHRNGAYFKDRRIAESFREVFHEIRRQNTTELIKIPLADADHEWKNIRKSLEEKVNLDENV